MPNVLTNLFPIFYEALDVVSREMVGFIPAVTLNADAARAALNQQILVPITPSATLIDNTPAVTSPDAGDQTIGNASIAITKSKSAPIRWNGEQQLGMRNAGTFDPVFRQQIEQGFRALVNMVEADLFAVAYQNASRASGTAGTAPFGTAGDLSDAAYAAQILDDNGAPVSDRHLVMGSAAVVNLRGKQTLVLKANEAGSASFRESGRISEIPLSGFELHNSNAVKPVVKGTGASYVTNGATAAGINQVVLKTGTGTVLAGDIVTFAGDTANKYVVNAGVAAAGTIGIGNPGLRNAIADANALTVGGNYTPNIAFSRNAIQLVTRAPALPTDASGRTLDAAIDATLITDERSGITFQIAVYPQYKQVEFQIGLAWGVASIKSEHSCIVIG